MSSPDHSEDDIATPKFVGGLPEATEPVVDSAALLQGGRSALILHNGATYRLRATRAGKLILTK